MLMAPQVIEVVALAASVDQSLRKVQEEMERSTESDTMSLLRSQSHSQLQEAEKGSEVVVREEEDSEVAATEVLAVAATRAAAWAEGLREEREAQAAEAAAADGRAEMRELAAVVVLVVVLMVVGGVAGLMVALEE
tara:strand:- start:4 stop:411 length:408 start_codon:yes stop_codon:yes gene_type:complete